MRPLLSLLALGSVAQALYFYVDGTAPRCFVEELPKDTLVVGDYRAEEWDPNQKQWATHDGINIYISVDVCIPPFRRSHTPCCAALQPSGWAGSRGEIGQRESNTV